MGSGVAAEVAFVGVGHKDVGGGLGSAGLEEAVRVAVVATGELRSGGGGVVEVLEEWAWNCRG